MNGPGVVFVALGVWWFFATLAVLAAGARMYAEQDGRDGSGCRRDGCRQEVCRHGWIASRPAESSRDAHWRQ
jgi:hypothetical protein